MFLGRVLPPHHLGDDTRSVLTLASGTLSVLSALVIGLLISYAKGNFDAETKVVQKFATDLVLVDRVILQYGPETGEARDLLRRYTALKIALTWPEENTQDGPRLDDPTALAMLEGVQAKLLELTPQGEAQRWLQARALQIGGELAEERWLLAAENEGSVPQPFLATPPSGSVALADYGRVRARSSSLRQQDRRRGVQRPAAPACRSPTRPALDPWPASPWPRPRPASAARSRSSRSRASARSGA